MIYLTNRFNNDEQDFIDDVISSGVAVRVVTKEELGATQTVVVFYQ